ncbi:hypothetical protein LCER1_G005468 [Lachnellula cervina]|uniref:Mso1 N-terminal domain-containing protein n=1 Tax=Lachnellula cervina TaxID=1316786 RepID=A0A7D8URA3_9HELO|nr:hypothetical protein LCER1_G005468 [Lachnellula cervina]
MSYMQSFSTLLTSTTSRFASVKNTLLATENDGDTEDDTHICRLLRNYYDDKRQPYPGWLPPDPKGPPPQQPALVMTNVGAGYGGFSSQQQGAPGQSGQLSSLWPTQAPSQPQPTSLRKRPVLGSQRQIASANPIAPVNSRRLPSEKDNSYQKNYSYEPAPPPVTSTTGRLSSKFRPNRAASPAARPAAQERQASSNSTYSGGYEDNSSSYGSQGRSGASSTPYLSSNSPWSGGDNEAVPMNSQDLGRRGVGRQGLPSGPKAGRFPAGYQSKQPGY